MNEKALNVVARLNEQPVLTLGLSEWGGIEDQFDEVERHRTHIKGDLVIIRIEPGYAAVEEPAPNQIVLRRLGDINEVRRFVTDRLETYERMWDGCGCRIDYYS